MESPVAPAFVFAQPIATKRLTLVPASALHVQAELSGNTTFGELIGATIPESWPPGEYDRDAQEYFLNALNAAGDAGVGWFGWYALLGEGNGNMPTVIGCGGYFGPPSAEGVVEVGYSVCPEWQGNGYASELTRALVVHVLQLPGVSRVIAHTYATNGASMGVLRKSGFVQMEVSDQPEALLFEWSPASVSK